MVKDTFFDGEMLKMAVPHASDAKIRAAGRHAGRRGSAKRCADHYTQNRGDPHRRAKIREAVANAAKEFDL
eukprot:gene17735-10912_t